MVGTGRGAEDGSVFVGYRWLEQLPGAHTAGPQGDYLNRHAIGICLVGNFDESHPTQTQLRALAYLSGCLMRSYGIPASQFICCTARHR